MRISMWDFDQMTMNCLSHFQARLFHIAQKENVMLDMKRMFIVAPCFLLILLMLLSIAINQSNAVAKDLDSRHQALNAISEFADNLCGEIKEKGTKSVKGISGKAKADLPGFLKKMVNIGIEGSAKFQTTEYQGVLQEDLANVLKDTRDCKYKVFEKLEAKFFPSIPIEKPLHARTAPSNTGISQYSQALNNLRSKELEIRRPAIQELRMIGTQSSDIEMKKAVKQDLERFVRKNIMNRKAKGEGILEDRGTYKAEDIVTALRALQAVKRSSGGRLEVDMTNINFDRVSFGKIDVEGFDFTHSSFQYAFLPKIMKNAIFDHADLSFAAIWNSDMSNASFHKTILNGTKFANVELRRSNIEQAADKRVALFGAKGLTKDQLDKFPRHDR